MKQITLFLIALLYFAGNQVAMGQKVSVTYQGERSTLTIANRSGQEIIVFSNDVSQDEGDVFEPNSFAKNVEPSGVTFPYYYMTLPHDDTHTFKNVHQIPEKFVYFEYQVVDEKYAISHKKVILAKDFTGYNHETDTVPAMNNAGSTQTVKTTTPKIKPVAPEKPAKKQITEPQPVENPGGDQTETLVNAGLTDEIPDNLEDVEEFESEQDSISAPYTTLFLTGIVSLLLIVGAAVYVRSLIARKKSKKKKKEKGISGKSTLLIEDDDTLEVVSYHVGLKDIKEKSGVDYYVIQMSDILEDTTITEVYLSRKVILDIYKFFSNFLKYDDKTNETGCFLIGRWDYAPNSNRRKYAISIEAIVEPSDDAVYGEYNLNFGAKIGVTLNYAIEKLCEKTGNEYVHTAWMHSHPGLGLFLSNQDLSVQSQLAHSQHFGRMLAIVLDSNTPDLKMALFTPKSNGAMNNDIDVKKILSLESLYQWAKTSFVKEEKQTPQPAVIQNYFSVEVSSKTSAIAKISMSGFSIIDMDMAIMPDATGLRGYFYGVLQENELLINSFEEVVEGTPPKETPVACFWVLPHFSSQETLPPFMYGNVAIIYGLEDGKIYVVANGELLTFASLREMKEWTRRKR